MITPDEAAFVREPMVIGTATYGPKPQRYCQYCGGAADIADIDGTWCSTQCQTYDRQSEITIWRRWEQ